MANYLIKTKYDHLLKILDHYKLIDINIDRKPPQKQPNVDIEQLITKKQENADLEKPITKKTGKC